MVIGFIGLGNMASAMVRGIAAAQLEGVTLCGHNPHPEKAKELAASCENAEAFMTAMKEAFPDYIGENYLEMSAGYLYQ